MNPHEDDVAGWAAADDLVDGFVKRLQQNPMPTSDLAMNLLAIENPNRLMMMSMIAATALQQLAGK